MTEPAAPQGERWIVIPKWQEFQHYKDRDPKWIKAYTRLLSDPEYLQLTFRLRGILHSLWLLYAASDGAVRWSDVGSMLARAGTKQGEKPVGRRDIEALSHAGFITLSASRPLALRYQAASPEVEKEKKDLARTRAWQSKPKNAYEREHPYVCPNTGCHARLKSERRLLEHLENAHNLEGEAATAVLQRAGYAPQVTTRD